MGDTAQLEGTDRSLLVLNLTSLVTRTNAVGIDTTRSQAATLTTNNFPSVLRTKLTSNTQALTSKDFENTRQIKQKCQGCHGMDMASSAVEKC
jgi:hypothetical protein